MKISYNWLKQYIEKLPKPEKLAELLTMHSFEVEEIKKKGNDYIFNIDILPNRAHDCLSHIGVAREAAAITNSKFLPRRQAGKIPSFAKATEGKQKTNDFIKVEVKDKDACPRYTALVITDIKVGPSPTWLQHGLRALDQKPINNIVDAANYVMLETGQPLHAFDLDKLSRPQSGSRQRSGQKTIIVRKAKTNEKITTLDNETCKLNQDVLIIADTKSPLAIAGVKGGKKAEIVNKTRNIVLESANFNYKAVRLSCKKTNIRTEASLRFEHELDPNLTSQAINRLASLIQEIAGGDIGKLIDIYPKRVFPKKIKLNLGKVEALLGIKVSKQDVIKYLKSLEFDVDNSLKVTVPTFRQDIKIEQDLIEEIARLIGYNNIPVAAPLGLLGVTKLDDVLSLTNKIKTIFESFGFTEIYNVSFVGENDLKKIGISQKDYLELKNPLSLDLKYLRKDLLVNLLKNARDNLKAHGSDNIKIFEIGKTYREKKEEMMLAGLIAGKDKQEEYFYELKGVIDGLFNKLGITDHWYDTFQATPEWIDNIFWHKPSAAEIKIGDDEIGFMGEIDSKILNNLNIKGIITGFNLNFEKIIKLAREELIYQPVSSYPAAVRDLAILVNRGDRVVDVLNVINDAGGELVQDVDLFDMYDGEEIPKGKKSLAFRIIYQSSERTLKDKEIDKIQTKIITTLEKSKGWEVRK